MKVVWTRLAQSDRISIREHISIDNPKAALAFDAMFINKASILALQPGMGRRGRVAGTRELVAHRHYILVYDSVADTVRILRIIHTAKKWPSGM
ncbi:MAG: type II toxin-antitoxin system RelE/ParE family toxin [Pseudomonadota bacterium]